MKRTEFIQETRKLRFEEAYEGCKSGVVTHAEAALLCLVYVIVHCGVIDANMTQVDWKRCWISA